MNNKVEILLLLKGDIVQKKEIEYSKWELIKFIDYFDLDHVDEFIEVHGIEVVKHLKNLFEIAQ